MRNAKADDNQKEIVSLFRAEGCTVESLHRVGKGVPDLLVGYLGYNHLVEVKGEKGNLNDEQIKWHSAWAGEMPEVVRNRFDVLGLIAEWKSTGSNSCLYIRTPQATKALARKPAKRIRAKRATIK